MWSDFSDSFVAVTTNQFHETVFQRRMKEQLVLWNISFVLHEIGSAEIFTDFWRSSFLHKQMFLIQWLWRKKQMQKKYFLYVYMLFLTASIFRSILL